MAKSLYRIEYHFGKNGAIAVEVCGALTGGLLGGLFHLFFGEDIQLLYNAPDAEAKAALGEKLLTLKTEPRLLHNIFYLFSMRNSVSCPFLSMAVVLLCCRVS